jgi:hypothetical protein
MNTCSRYSVWFNRSSLCEKAKSLIIHLLLKEQRISLLEATTSNRLVQRWRSTLICGRDSVRTSVGTPAILRFGPSWLMWAMVHQVTPASLQIIPNSSAILSSSDALESEYWRHRQITSETTWNPLQFYLLYRHQELRAAFKTCEPAPLCRSVPWPSETT